MIIYECDMCGKHYKSADSVRVVELPSKRSMLTVPEKKRFMLCEECGEQLCNFILCTFINKSPKNKAAKDSE